MLQIRKELGLFANLRPVAVMTALVESSPLKPEIVAGVDLLRSNHGPVVMEVNSSPGLEGIEQSSKKDVAGMIIEFIEKSLAKPPKSGNGTDK